VQLRGATVRAVAARHAPGRPPLRRAGAPLGYVVEGPLRVYFAGDTALFDGMADIGARSLDAALLPVWGWGSSLGPGHLDPKGQRWGWRGQYRRSRLACPLPCS
jgi:L-ascorbate metabolism protein UlaG (beta-lactamase superfamily)